MRESSVSTRREGGRRRRAWAPRTLAALFAGSGVIHLTRPSVFTPLIPSALPAPTALVYVSGVAELVCAYGLLTRRRWGGPASALLLLVVWPGNVQMAVDATGEHGFGSAQAVATWIRVPLQLPLIWMALQDRPSQDVPDIQNAP